MSTPMDMNGEKAAEERRGKRIVRGLKWGLLVITVVMVIPMIAALASTIIMTPVLIMLMEATRSYGDLWPTGWVVSAIGLYVYLAYLMIVYRYNQWRERRKWGWLEEL